MFEFVIFILPILIVEFSIYKKTLRSEESTIDFITSRNKYGSKGYMLRAPHVFVVHFSFILSINSIALGLFWAIWGCVLLLGTIAYLLFSDGVIYIPSLASSEFDKLVIKRKNQAIVSALIIMFWVFSWCI